MLTLGTTFGLTAFAMSGGDKNKEQAAPLNASSKEEERYIQYAHTLFPCYGPIISNGLRAGTFCNVRV